MLMESNGLILWTAVHGSKPETHSFEFKKFCHMLYLIKRSASTDREIARDAKEKLEKRFNSNYFDRGEAVKVWNAMKSATKQKQTRD